MTTDECAAMAAKTNYYKEVISVCIPGGSGRPLDLIECVRERDRVIAIARGADSALLAAARENDALRARLAELESDNATLAAECRAWRLAKDDRTIELRPGLYGGYPGRATEQEFDVVRQAIAATDAAGALGRTKGGGA